MRNGTLAAAWLLLSTPALAGQGDTPIHLRRPEEPIRLRSSTIDRLQSLLARNPEGLIRAEMLHRLADLYWQQSRSAYLVEMSRYDRLAERCFAEVHCSLDDIEPDTRGSTQIAEKAVALYRHLLAQHPDYARADEATYHLGMTLRDLDRSEEAHQVFVTLVRSFPGSPRLTDANLLVGEHLFDRGDFYGALPAYLRASGGEAPKHGFARYKLAWSYYLVGDVEEAAAMMRDLALDRPATPTFSDGQLREEALRDLARFYADLQVDPFELVEIGDALEPVWARELIRRLAGHLYDRGEFELAVGLYEQLIDVDPTSEHVPELQARIVESQLRLDDVERVIEGIRALGRVLDEDGGWAAAQRHPYAVTQARRTGERLLRRVADEARARAASDRLRCPALAVAEQAWSTWLVHLAEPRLVAHVAEQLAQLRAERYAAPGCPEW